MPNPKLRFPLLPWYAPLVALAAAGHGALAQPEASQFGFLTGAEAGSGGVLDALRARPNPAAAPAALPPADREASGDLAADSDVPAQSASPEAAAKEARLPAWLQMGLTVQTLYDDNIFLAAGNQTDSLIFRTTPTFRVGTPDGAEAVWLFEGMYFPTWGVYTTDSGLNRFDQAVRAGLKYQGPSLRSGLYGSYVEVTGNERYIQDVVLTRNSKAEWEVDYELSGRTSLESRLQFARVERDDTPERVYNDEDILTWDLSALWQATPLTRLGPSVRLGVFDSSLAVDRESVDVALRADYVSSELLTFNLRGGAQRISYDGPSGSPEWKPSVQLAAQYDPNPLWRFTLSGYSTNSASADSNSSRQATGVNGTLSWMPLDRLSLHAGGGYEKAETDFQNDSPSRDDDYFFGEFRIRAGAAASPVGLEIFYRHRTLDSDMAERGFENNQTGLQLVINF